MKKKKNGRPQKLNADDKKKLVECAKFGLTDEQISAVAGITPKTLANYKNRDPKFLQALKESKDLADTMVRKSLFKLANGFEYEEEMVNKDGAVRVTKYARPDVTACIFWLKNRQPEEWREKHELDLGKGSVDAIQSIAKLFARRSEKEAKRLAAGENPALVLFGRAGADLTNGVQSSSN